VCVKETVNIDKLFKNPSKSPTNIPYIQTPHIYATHSMHCTHSYYHTAESGIIQSGVTLTMSLLVNILIMTTIMIRMVMCKLLNRLWRISDFICKCVKFVQLFIFRLVFYKMVEEYSLSMLK
jgi:hypothetical protein